MMKTSKIVRIALVLGLYTSGCDSDNTTQKKGEICHEYIFQKELVKICADDKDRDGKFDSVEQFVSEEESSVISTYGIGLFPRLNIFIDNKKCKDYNFPKEIVEICAEDYDGDGKRDHTEINFEEN